MILSDRDIAAALDEGRIEFEPGIDCDGQVQPASVDLRMGDALKRGGERLRPGFNKEFDEKFDIRPFWDGGDFYLGTTLESVSLPDDLLGIMAGRSTFGREGLVVHATAGWVDPGFEGQLTLEMANFGPETVTVRVGERVCQIGFLECKSKSSGYDGHYQGQRGPTESRRGGDDD